LRAQQIDAPRERGVRRTALQRAVDRAHDARELGDLPRGMRGLGKLDLALQLGEMLLPLLRALFALTRAASVALEIPFVAAGVVPFGEAVRENGLERAVRHLRERAPLLDPRLFLALVGGAGGGQGLQEFGALRHARGERERAIRGVDASGAALVARPGRGGSFVQQLQQRSGAARGGGRLRGHGDAARQVGEPRRQRAHRRLGGGEPARERLLAFAVLAHLDAEQRPRGDELVRQRFVERGDVERGPGAVQLDQAIGWNRLLLEQPARGRDQSRRFRERLAPRHRGFPARLGRAVEALVLIAELARRLLERFLVRERGERGELEVDIGRLAGELQQRLVVGLRRRNPFAPGLQLRFGRRGGGLRTRALRGGRGDLPRP